MSGGTVETLAEWAENDIRRLQALSVIKYRLPYGITGNTAVMEMASSSGLPVPIEKIRFILLHSGVDGDMIKDAIERLSRFYNRYRRQRNDGGVGMLQSLGFSFSDKDGKEVEKGGKYLADIVDVDTSGR